MLLEFINTIQDFETIIIFRHIDGDGDALGSQWGLYDYLTDKYPNKNIYAVGDITKGYSNLFPTPHTIDDSVFQNALAIVVDTANKARISDERYSLCQRIIKIDHHLPVDDYGDLSFVDDNKSSCAEIVASMLKDLEDDQPLKSDVAKNLYTGIVSDTQSFSISSVTSETFDVASYLMKSELNVNEIVSGLNQIDRKLFEFQIYISNKIKFYDEGLAHLIIDKSDLEKYNLSQSEVKRFVGVMRNISGISVWVLFTQQEDDTYSASIRSNATIISDVAQKYDGGGHLFASGVKGLTPDTIKAIIKDLINKIETK